MLTQSLAASGQVEAGFVLLRQMGTGLLSHSNEDCYPVFRTLLKSCVLVGDFGGASRLQATVDQLGLKACACIATAIVQGSKKCWESATNSDGTWDAPLLWFEIRQKMSYVSQLQALPQGFIQCGTSRQLEGTLQVHAEKNATFNAGRMHSAEPRLHCMSLCDSGSKG